MPKTIVEAITAVKQRGAHLPTPQIVCEICRALGHRWRHGLLPGPPSPAVALLSRDNSGQWRC
ncbi:MAG: hypothetical protein JSV91_08225 [Phycisphaerales bacterium]|nr:MAG: hypothetical protein JSV91_08225 [Phycisphaerales bacterium]